MKKSILTLSLAAVALGAAASVPLPAVERPSRLSSEEAAKVHRTPTSRNNVMRRVAPSGKVLMGYQSGYSYGNEIGMFRLNTDAECELMFIDDYTSQGYNLGQGWIRDGRLSVLADYTLFDLVDLRYLELDPYTGEILEDREIDIYDPVTQFPNYLPAFWSAAYIESKDRIYGYGPSENGQGYAFFSAPADNPAQAVSVRTPQYTEICIALAYDPEAGKLYGINRDDDLVVISPETGLQTVVMPTGLRTRYSISGMIYVPETKKLLLNTSTVEYVQGIAEIDPEAKTITQLCEYDNLEQYAFFYFVDSASDPAPIREPELDEAVFDHAAGNGTVSYFIPTEYFAGGTLSGNMTWYSTLDGEPYADGTTTAGDIVSVSFTGLPQGKHDFGFYVSQDGKRSAVNHHVMYVGYDIPNAPTNVTLSENEITWTEVTRCVNGGHLEPSELKYHVYLNNEEIGVTKDTRFELAIPEDTPFCSYRAKVVADNMGQLSSSAYSSSERWGAPWTLDFNIEPNNADASVCSAFDLNGDGNVWDYLEDDENPGHGEFYGARGTTESNDWIFLPPMNLDDPQASYEITYEIGNFSSWYDDLEVGVFLHDKLDPRTNVTTIQETRKFNNTKEYDTYTQRFAITEPGTYYVSFFNKAPAYHGGIRLRNITVKKLSTANTLPAEVSNFSAHGAAMGELKAIINFDLPSKYISGEDIPAETEVTASVTVGDNNSVATGAPGQHFTIELPTVQGWNRVQILTSIDGSEGKETVSDVFTGIDVPGPVSSIGGYVTEDNLTMVAQWTAPTEGENGYYINPADVVYNLMEYSDDEGWVVAEVLGKGIYEYSMSLPAGTPLSSARMGIAASTVAGTCSTVAWITDMLGQPHKLPVTETFENASFKYGPIRIVRLDDDYVDSEWGVVNPRLIDPAMDVPSGVACYGRSEGPTQKGMLMLPKFDLEGEVEPGVVFNVWTGPNAAEITIYGETFDSNGFVELAKIPRLNNGWQTIEIPFPDSFLNHKWVALYIDAFFPSESHYALISEYSVRGGVNSIYDIPVGEGWIRAGIGSILIQGFAGQDGAIFSLDGRQIWGGKVTADSMEVPVAAGTYVVRVGDSSLKLVVR